MSDLPKQTSLTAASPAANPQAGGAPSPPAFQTNAGLPYRGSCRDCPDEPDTSGDDYRVGAFGQHIPVGRGNAEADDVMRQYYDDRGI
jgi:hypothetical protein